jgi:gluconokinase
MMRHDKLLVTGVSGCGKSRLSSALAQALSAELLDETPSEWSLAHVGVPGQPDVNLWSDDAWLDAAALRMAELPKNVILTCLALRQHSRDRLRAVVPGLRIVFVDVRPIDAIDRLSLRATHPFPASLLASQFEILQKPVVEPDVLVLRAEQALARQTRMVIDWLST